MNAFTTVQRQYRELLLKRRDRELVEMRGYCVRADGQIVDLRVLDLSHNGCGIECETAFLPMEEVKLSVLGRGATRARVQWSDGRKAGLIFENEPAQRQHWPRRAERIPLSAEVFLRRAGKIGFRVQIFDMSPYGCKCEFVDRPSIDESVWVKFERLEAIQSDVCWIEGSTLGVRFRKPLHPAVFDLLLQRLDRKQWSKNRRSPAAAG